MTIYYLYDKQNYQKYVSIQPSAVSRQRSAVSGQPLAFGHATWGA
ncbi:hypothetical protein [Moorena sp. SIO3I8]|nr:hypothetical protein [Moorena sp. SIO3I8]